MRNTRTLRAIIAHLQAKAVRAMQLRNGTAVATRYRRTSNTAGRKANSLSAFYSGKTSIKYIIGDKVYTTITAGQFVFRGYGHVVPPEKPPNSSIRLKHRKKPILLQITFVTKGKNAVKFALINLYYNISL